MLIIIDFLIHLSLVKTFSCAHLLTKVLSMGQVHPITPMIFWSFRDPYVSGIIFHSCFVNFGGIVSIQIGFYIMPLDERILYLMIVPQGLFFSIELSSQTCCLVKLCGYDFTPLVRSKKRVSALASNLSKRVGGKESSLFSILFSMVNTNRVTQPSFTIVF